MIMRTESLECGPVESLAMVRMGYADEKLCALLHRLAVEVYCSEFGHYIVHMRSCGHDSAAFDDHRRDLAAAFVGA